jgi:hypothetical protein
VGKLISYFAHQYTSQPARYLPLLTIIYVPRGPSRRYHAHSHSTGTEHAKGPTTKAPQQGRGEETHDEAHEAHKHRRYARVHATTNILFTDKGFA